MYSHYAPVSFITLATELVRMYDARDEGAAGLRLDRRTDLRPSWQRFYTCRYHNLAVLSNGMRLVQRHVQGASCDQWGCRPRILAGPPPSIRGLPVHVKKVMVILPLHHYVPSV